MNAGWYGLPGGMNHECMLDGMVWSGGMNECWMVWFVVEG